jgi:hypothetical protein
MGFTGPYRTSEYDWACGHGISTLSFINSFRRSPGGKKLPFFSHVLLNILALVALLRRWVGCIPIFITAFILDRLDWIVLGLNPLSFAPNQSDFIWTDFVSQFGGIGLMAILQLCTISLMAVLLQSELLTSSLSGGLRTKIRQK